MLNPRPRPNRAQSRERARRINDLCLAGLTPEEIAVELGIKVDTLWSLRRRWGFPLATRRGARRLFLWLPQPQVEAIDRLAAEVADGDRAKALAQIIAGLMAPNEAIARRTLARVRRAVEGIAAA